MSPSTLSSLSVRPFVLRSLRRLALLSVGLGSLVGSTMGPAPVLVSATIAPCSFVFGFARLQQALPEQVGHCLDNERFDPESGVTAQPTTRGLMIWRQSDNLLAFTDGSTLWVNEPQGPASVPYEGISLPWVAAKSAVVVAATPDALTPLEVSAGSSGGAAAAASPLPSPSGATQRQARFILAVAEAARASERETGVPASVTVAQAILESDWGTSRLSREYHNYFGIKPTGRELRRQEQVVWFDAWEVVDGEDVIKPEPFRAYASLTESFIEHGRFFLRNGRYKDALAVRDDAKQFAREIADAGYATDPSYAPKLIELMDRFNLYAYDLP